MKNLLVDALRQASGDNAPAESDAPDPASPGATPEATPAVEPESRERVDLELAESTVLPESVRPTPPANHVFDEVSLPEPEADVDEPDPTIEDPTMLVPALAVGYEPESPDADVTVTGATPRLEWILLFGRWSPALCLLALSAAAGTLALYQRLSAEHLNVELGTLTEGRGTDVEVVGDTDGWWHTIEPDAAGSGPEPTLDAPVSAQPSTIRPSTTHTPSSAQDVPAALPEADAVVVVRDAMDELDDPAHAAAQAGFQAYSRGDLESAERYYLEALAIAPQHRHALIGYAAVLQKTARGDAAIRLYESLLTLEPEDTDALAALLSYASAGDARQNESRLKLLLQRHPDAAALHFAMGLSMAERGRWPEAHRAFLEANARAPGNADYSFNVAVSAEHLGQPEVARRYYESALATATAGSLVDRKTIAAQLELLAMNGGDSS